MCLPFRSRFLGLVMLLAFLVTLPLGAGCAPQQQHGDHPLAPEWTWYHDSRFGFHLPLPPGWRTDTWVATPGKIADCAYHVDVFPPTSSGQAGPGAEAYEPVLIGVLVMVNCRPWQAADDTHFTPEQRSITMSGVQAVLYDNDTPRYALERLAVADFSGHQYLFKMHYLFNYQAPPSQAQQDQELGLYMQMLRGFRAP
jgi:hypothetical protein